MPGGSSAAQPVGLDFGAVLAMGAAKSVDMSLLADVLPAVERAILTPLYEQAEAD